MELRGFKSISRADWDRRACDAEKEAADLLQSEKRRA